VRVHDPLAAVLADLARAARATHHLLEPLDPAEATLLLDCLLADSEASTATRERVLQRADGAPFFLVRMGRLSSFLSSL